MIKTVSLVILILGAISLVESCTSPVFSNVRTSVTQDTKLNTETAYIVEFNVKCARSSKNALFYGEFNGNYIVSSTDETGQRHQITWTENHKKATSGEIKVRIFDEEGFVSAKKAQRNNEDLTKVKELTTISFYHKGAFSNFFIQSELVAVVVYGALFYLAQSIRDGF